MQLTGNDISNLSSPRPGAAVRLRRVLLMGLATVFVSGCSSWFESDDRNEPMTLTTFTQKIEASIAWRAPVGSGSSYGFAPAVVGTNVYAASTSGHVARIDLTTGATVWNVQLDKKLSAGVGADESTVVVVTPQAEVIALDMDGQEKWRVKASSEVNHTPWVGKGVVVVRAGDYRVQAFNAENGERIWSVQRPGPALSLRAPSRMTFTQDLIITGIAVNDNERRVLPTLVGISHLGPKDTPSGWLLLCHGILQGARELWGRELTEGGCVSTFYGT